MSYCKDANKNGLSQCRDVQTLIKYKNISHFTNFASKYYFCRIFRFWEKPFPWKCFYVPLFLKGWQQQQKNRQFGLWGINNLSQIIIILGKGTTGEFNQQKCSSSLTELHPRPREFNSFRATYLLQCIRLPFRKSPCKEECYNLWHRPQLMRKKNFTYQKLPSNVMNCPVLN